VVAARLSENGRHSVALLEAGRDDRLFWVQVPLGVGKLVENPEVTWQYEIENEVAGRSRTRVQPRGKLLGGSGSINGMVYMRGQRQDFDHWRQLGNVGWSYDDVLRFFKKGEANVRGESDYHGGNGPLVVSDVPKHDVCEAYIAAGERSGHPRNEDFNGSEQEGFGYCQLNTRKGRRHSTATAYLEPARNRPNLVVRTHQTVKRLLLEGRRVVGVEVWSDGQLRRLHSRAEVILSCGTINTPQLLQLSGLGPADVLQNAGVTVLEDVPEVGCNLADHFSVPLTYKAAKPVTINDIVNNPVRGAAMFLEYLLFRKGWMSTGGNFCNGFIRSHPSLEAPDLRLHLCLWNRKNAERLGTFMPNMGLVPYSSFHINLNLLHPECAGTIEITGPDIEERPRVRFVYSMPEHDRRAVLHGIRVSRSLMASPEMAPYVEAELTPGPGKIVDDDLLEYCFQNGGSNMHSVGTCRMGADERAVVDPRLKMRAVDGLRIADASIMPSLIGGNTNAATIMIGEKAAAMILEDSLAVAVQRN
jgi:choline dehydrogenase